jgi:predicted amidophosphoribosyltransferase
MTVLAEPELKQKRFLCANCERELFLNALYCDNCGGKIEWPQEYESILSDESHEEEKGEDNSRHENRD